MNMRSLASLAIVTALLLFPHECRAVKNLEDTRSWICFYGESLPAGTPRYDLYVFDGSDHPDLSPLRDGKADVVGYVSLGEVARHDSHFDEIESKGLLVDENEEWPGSFRVKIGDRRWRKIVINRLIPEVMARGFDGIFMDTVDTASYLEDTRHMKGQIKGAIRLIEEIRRKYPSIIMVLNNGLFLTDSVGDEIDALAVEDIYTLYDFDNKRYRLARKEWMSERLALVKKFQEDFKKPVLSLDFLEKTDTKAIRDVAKKAFKEGFVPYISDINLRSVFFHP